MKETLRRMRQARDEEDRGFTLIELLVVVVIIGVLIAIAIPLYLNYRQGAENKSAASDLRGAISTLEQCYTDNNSTYPTAITANAAATNYALTGCTTGVINNSSSNTITYLVGTGAYEVYSLHTGNGTWYCYSSGSGGSVKTEPSGTAKPTVYAAACP